MWLESSIFHIFKVSSLDLSKSVRWRGSRDRGEHQIGPIA